MSHPMRDLDAAIDRVAASLVQVADDPQAAERIVRSLPPRSANSWRLTPSLWIQAAAAASIVVAAMYLRATPGDAVRSAIELPRPAIVADTRVVEPAVARSTASQDEAPAGPAIAVRLGRAASVSEEQARFELPEIEPPPQLTIGADIAVMPLNAVQPVSVAPIVLADLPLGGDAQTPISKE